MKNFSKTWFETWGEEQAQSTILKALLLLLTTLLVTSIIAIVVLAKRPPLLIGLYQNKTQTLTPESANAEQSLVEIERTVRKFSEEIYNWDQSTINQVLDHAARLVAKDFRQAYLVETKSQIDFAVQKNASQKFFIAGYESKANNQAIITGDRIVVIDGIRATSPLTLEISYVLGERSLENPEGVYITNKQILENADSQLRGLDEHH